MSKKEHNKAAADRAYDAEQIFRYFVKRDSMNAEVHLDDHERGLNVRYSPITIAAERVLGWLWVEAYGTTRPPPSIRDI
jgi:hypothetical protein